MLEILEHTNLREIITFQEKIDGMKISNNKNLNCETHAEDRIVELKNKNPDRKASKLLNHVLSGPVSPVAKWRHEFWQNFVNDFSGLLIF